MKPSRYDQKSLAANATVSSVLLISFVALGAGAFAELGDAQSTVVAGRSVSTTVNATHPSIGSRSFAAVGSFAGKLAKVAEQFRNGVAKTRAAWGNSVDLVAIARNDGGGLVDLRVRARTNHFNDRALGRDLTAVRNIAELGFETGRIDHVTVLFPDGLIYAGADGVLERLAGLGKHVSFDVHAVGGEAKSLIVRKELPGFAGRINGSFKRLFEFQFSRRSYETVAGPFDFDELVSDGSAMNWVNTTFAADPGAAFVARWESKPVARGYRGLAKDYPWGANSGMAETQLNVEQAAQAAAHHLRENLRWWREPQVTAKELSNGNLELTAYLPRLTRDKLSKVNGALADAVQNESGRWPIRMHPVDFVNLKPRP